MQADKTVIANLQTSCQLLAALAGQYQVDVQQLKAMDLDWLACRVKHWYGHTEEHLRIFVRRLLYFGQDPEYDAGSVSGAATVTALLTRSQTNVYAAFDQMCAFRAQAWNARADGVPDLYEHAIQSLEKQAFKIERELALIAKLGQEEYIAARLEDGE